MIVAYPEELEIEYATGLLQVCNRDARFELGSGRQMLSAGQTLRGVCLTVKGLSFSKFLAQTKLAVGNLMAEMADREAQAAGGMGGDPGSPAAEQTAGAASATGTCSIGWTSSQPVRDVQLTNSCPVYTNACSGPSDLLGYQAGWTGSSGKLNCDVLFLNNLERACDFLYSGSPTSIAGCKSTANIMFTVVSLAPMSYFTPGE
eukprot:gene12757-12886_t